MAYYTIDTESIEKYIDKPEEMSEKEYNKWLIEKENYLKQKRIIARMSKLYHLGFNFFKSGKYFYYNLYKINEDKELIGFKAYRDTSDDYIFYDNIERMETRCYDEKCIMSLVINGFEPISRDTFIHNG